MTIRRTRIRRGRVAAILVVVAITAVLCDQLLAISSEPATAPTTVRVAETDEPRALPDEVVEDEDPGVANLDPALREALDRAATRAANEGVDLLIESGWRSPERQQQLLDDAVAKYGSLEQAARWVATPDRSAHVSGDAVDIGPSAAAAWLSRNGAAYGLCPTYANEPWHYELRPDAAVQGCPPMYPDPTHDPRMQP